MSADLTMPDRILTDDDRENLAHIIRWHALAAGAHEEDTYLSLGVENTLIAVERIVAKHRELLAEAWDRGWFARDEAEGEDAVLLTPPDAGMSNPYKGADHA